MDRMNKMDRNRIDPVHLGNPVKNGPTTRFSICFCYSNLCHRRSAEKRDERGSIDPQKGTARLPGKKRTSQT